MIIRGKNSDGFQIFSESIDRVMKRSITCGGVVYAPTSVNYATVNYATEPVLVDSTLSPFLLR